MYALRQDIVLLYLPAYLSIKIILEKYSHYKSFYIYAVGIIIIGHQ
jgi:hypothetical protein